MIILGKKLSEKTNVIIEDILPKLQVPVTFHDLDLSGAGGYGAIDCYPGQDYIEVFLSTKLTGDVFETNLLHELFHGLQMVEGYPLIVNNSDNERIADLGRQLQATILDLDVHKRLDLNGYSSLWFINQRYNQIKSIVKSQATSDFNYSEMHLKFFSLQYLLFICLADQAKIEFATPLINNKFGDITSTAFELKQIIEKIGANSPDECFSCFVEIMNHLSLWDNHKIVFRGKIFSKEPNL